ncbi:MAG: YggT family protein [bacterium]
MFVFSNLLLAVARVLEVILTIMYWLILIRALISWVNPDPYNPIVQFLYKTTEPILVPIRRVLPIGMRMGFDLSPIIAFLTIGFVRNFVVRSLIDLSMRIQ